MTTDALARIRLRREATETLLRAGQYDGIGPAHMAAQFDRRYVIGPHTELMNAALARLLIEPGGSLMIFTPPRIGKSALASQWFPKWWLTMDPHARVVGSAYAERLAMRHALAVRGFFTDYGAQYGLTLSREQAAKSDWNLTTGGGMIARGIGGGLTGEDMHLGIIDDPVKDRAAAESVTIRDGAWDWYSSTFLSRVEPKTCRLVVMTRWHQDDLAGRILESEGRIEEGGVWRVVHLPALALPENPERHIYADPLGRAPGEPLTHPKIAPDDVDGARAHWERARRQSTARDWNALYMGVPYDAEGSLLDDAQVRAATAPAPASFKRIAVGVDPAGGASRDTVGIVAVGLDGERHAWFLDDRTARLSAADWPRTVCLVAHELDADRIVVEKNFGGDMGKQLIAQAWELLVREGAVSGLCPLVVEVVARRSKVLRAEPVAQAIITGRVKFAAGADLKQLKTEFTMWEPGSTWSPGALDAGVHAVTDLLPASPRGGEFVNPARRRRGESASGGLAGRRRGSTI
ncbi:MAG: terminase family protein [Micropruina sp.]|uniref:terminase large subunit domain-containing protein n=1 Tax=Micropruina sp. TaxID=2737536 RepID=UPI0039E59729